MKRNFKTIVLVILLITLSFSAKAVSFSLNPQAIEDAAQSVVMLVTFDDNGNITGNGSGFVAFNNYTLITNYHVIDGASTVLAISDDNNQYEVTSVVASDAKKDIAICEFASPTPMPALQLQSNNKLARGQSVVVIGSPNGRKNTVSKGNISRLFVEDNVYWVQITAPTYYGNSGGPLFDDEGNVIGINSAKYTEGENKNLAIHISEAILLYENRSGKKTEILNSYDEQHQQQGLVEDDVYNYVMSQEVQFDGKVEWYIDASRNLMVRFYIYNGTEDKTIDSVWTYAETFDQYGNTAGETANNGWSSSVYIKPGETGHTQYATIPNAASADLLIALLCNVHYTDGSYFDISQLGIEDYSPYYMRWEDFSYCLDE